MKFGTIGLIFAALGYFITKSPMGAFIGFFVGSAFEQTTKKKKISSNFEAGKYLMMLSSIVMKADGVTLKSELNFVKKFFVKQFGESKSSGYIKNLKTYLEKDISIEKVCAIIESNLNQSSKITILQYLIGIALADGEISNSEMRVLQRIAKALHISQRTFLSILAMFNFEYDKNNFRQKTNPRTTSTSSLKEAYQILRIDNTATESEIKKAYRKLAIKYHPDKVAQLGEEFQKGAKENFQKVQDAYELIKDHKNIP